MKPSYPSTPVAAVHWLQDGKPKCSARARNVRTICTSRTEKVTCKSCLRLLEHRPAMPKMQIKKAAS
jgi:hypothetical protein